MKKELIYVVDTNILVDCVDIVPDLEDPNLQPKNPTIDLSEAHIVIPTAVVRELSSFKKERSERGKAARVVLKRIRALFENDTHPMAEIYHLDDKAEVKVGERTFSLLPVHKNFKKALPFSPSEDDMDGQIILAALTVAFLRRGYPIDGTASSEQIKGLKTDNLMLLTNDNGLAIRARERGLRTNRFGAQYPEPYTGRRKVTVPREIFMEFFHAHRIERKDFEEALPDASRLIANEFIELVLENSEDYPRDYEGDFTEYVGRYDAKEDAIVQLKYVRDFPVWPRNVGQAIYAEALMDPDISAIICTGPAGSGKTFMATVYGYNACLAGDYIGVTVVPCENHGKLGALPGDLDEKMDPDVQPLKNALRNYLLKNDKKLQAKLKNFQKFGAGKGKGTDEKTGGEPEKRSIKVELEERVELIWKNWFSSIPIENARGRDFSHEIALYDEFQDQNISQADTLIKRIGSEGKIVLTGDIYQIHAPYLDVMNNGLVYASSQLFDHPMVAQVCFTEDEVIRHPLVREIAQRQKNNEKE